MMLQSTTSAARRGISEAVGATAERFSISGGSPQSNMAYAQNQAVPTTSTVGHVFQRNNPMKSASKVLGVCTFYNFLN